MKETTNIQMSSMDKMMQAMAKMMWMPSVVMGLAIVLISLYIGWLNSQNVAEWLSSSKTVRDVAEAGSSLALLKAGIESTVAWLPGFKFLGMGLLFSGIVFLLATIVGALRMAAINVQKAAGVTPKVLVKPMQAKLFPMIMMIGLIILIINFIVDLGIASTASSYWNHSIKEELDAAESGSQFLAQLSSMQSTKAWAEPLKFVGLAFLFTSIALALATIRQILGFQARRIAEIVEGK